MRIKEILEKIRDTDPIEDPTLLVLFFNESGIHSKNKNQTSTKIIVSITQLLKENPVLASALKRYIINLYSNFNPLTFYTDTGVLSSNGFYSEISQRLKYKILPPLEAEGNTQFLVRKIFYSKYVYKTLESINEQVLIELIDALNINPDARCWQKSNLNYLLNAMMILSQRITSMGLEPEVVSKLPEIDDLQSPFFGLYREVQHYVDCLKSDPNYINNNEEDYRQILVMCTQCHESVNELHKHKEKYGISISLAYMMLRLEQHLRRLKVILNLIELRDSDLFAKTLLTFSKEAINAENKRYGVRKYFNETFSLLAYKITEHSSRKGDHYRAVDKPEYYSMFKSALGGGFIVSFLVILKVLTHHEHFPMFGEAFFYSLIYSVGFVLIHFLHFTLATKQPALTANTIAVSIDEGNLGDKTMMKTVVLISEISRAQFISLIGNILIVLPFTFFIGMIYTFISGNYIVTSEEANEMIMSLHPWKSGSLFYAGIAGVFLMLSGVIAGYYDNKVIYSRIPERLQQHPYLKRVFNQNRLLKVSNYLQNNSGVIIGNIMLGFMLGFASMIGKIFGVPFDVRHVTLSAGVFGLVLQGNDAYLSLSFILEISFSLILMGLINLIISFGLAIYVAVRSRSLETSLMKILLKSLKHYFINNPSEFFYPSKKSNTISEI